MNTNYVENSSAYPKIKVLDIFCHAVKGVQYLHSLNILHRDIRPSNILVYIMKGGGEPRGLIADLGLSKELDPNHHDCSVSIAVGNDWMAPEVLRTIESSREDSGIRVTFKSDIFSLGCVWHYIVTGGNHPFGKYPSTRKYNIINENFNEMSINKGHSFHGLIKKMLSGPSVRPTIDVIIQHLDNRKYLINKLQIIALRES